MADTLILHGILQGCEVTQRGAGANMSVDVAAGFIIHQGTVKPVAATNVAITAADATLDRLDLIAIDSTGTVTAVAGTAAAPPSDPTSTDVIAGGVYVPAAVTSIITTYITTEPRALVSLPEPANTLAYTFLSGAQSNTDPGSGKCGFDAATNGAIAHLYISLSTPTAPGTVTEWLLNGGGVALMPYYLKLWSRSNPAIWWIGKVTAYTSHTGYYDLSIAFIDTADNQVGAPGPLAPPLQTLAADTVLEIVPGPIITASNGTSALSGDVTIGTANTFSDAVNTGSLVAGTYLIVATIALLSTANGHVFTGRIWDGSTTYVEGEVPSAAAVGVTLTLTIVVTLAASATLKLSATSDTGTTDKIKAAATKNSAGNLATVLSWVQVA